ncbi:MAG: insulinase family protein [Deltaproteobacteria bacterium]|nr:insulinase family protein [Deltaproteobacteria bacterium]
MRQFYDLWYHPERATVVVAGDLEPGAALTAIERAFAGVPAGPSAPPIPAEPDDAPGGTATVAAPTLTRPRVSLAWVGPAANRAPDDPRDRAALGVLGAALSKEKLGGAPIDAGTGDGVDRDLFVISATGPNASRDLARRMERVRREGIGAKQLAHEVEASLETLAERPLIAERPYFALAGAVGADVALDLGDVAAGTEQTLRALTPEIVRDAARRWLPAERAWVVRFEPTDPSLAARPLPDDPQALQRIAEEAAESGELDRAIAAYEKLLARNPNRMWTVIYLYETGGLRLRLGDLAGARRDLERALALVDYPAVRELLAEVEAQAKARGGALDAP